MAPAIMDLVSEPIQGTDTCPNELETLPINDIETTQIQDTLTEAFDASDVLLEVTGVMASTDGEGLSESAAEMAAIAVESIVERMGLKRNSIFVATEQFAAKETRKMATNISLEGIFEYLKTLWEHIQETAKKMWDAIERFFDKLVKTIFNRNSIEKSDKQLEEIQELMKAEKEGKLNVAAEQFSGIVFKNDRISEPFVNIDARPTPATVRVLCSNVEDNIHAGHELTEAYAKLIEHIRPLTERAAENITASIKDNRPLLMDFFNQEVDALIRSTTDHAIEMHFPEIHASDVSQSTHPPLPVDRLLKIRASKKMAHGDQLVMPMEHDEHGRGKHYDVGHSRPPQMPPVQMEIPSLSDLNNLAMHLKATKQKFSDIAQSDVDSLKRTKVTDMEVIQKIIDAVVKLEQSNRTTDEAKRDAGRSLRSLQLLTSRNLRMVSGISTHFLRAMQVSLEAIDRYVHGSIVYYKQKQEAQQKAA